jgi:hypothetical protein
VQFIGGRLTLMLRRRRTPPSSRVAMALLALGKFIVALEARHDALGWRAAPFCTIRAKLYGYGMLLVLELDAQPRCETRSG